MTDNVERSLGRIEQAVTDMQVDVRDLKTEVTARANKHSDRLGSLEKSRARLWGAGSVFSTLFLGVIGYWIKGRID